MTLTNPSSSALARTAPLDIESIEFGGELCFKFLDDGVTFLMIFQPGGSVEVWSLAIARHKDSQADVMLFEDQAAFARYSDFFATLAPLFFVDDSIIH